jgi:hypothetical protein
MQDLEEAEGGSGDSNRTWVLFTDDDDIWSYARVRTYMQSMLEQQNGLDTTVALLSETQADAAFHIGHNIFGPWSIDGMLECNAPGAVVLNMKHASGGEDPSTEHYNYCVRLSALQHFFTSCPGEVLTHKFWTCALSSTSSTGTVTFPLSRPSWMAGCTATSSILGPARTRLRSHMV